MLALNQARSYLDLILLQSREMRNAGHENSSSVRDYAEQILKIRALSFVYAVVFAFSVSSSSFAQAIPKQLENAKITEKMGSGVSIGEMRFTDDEGKEVALADYFKSGRPVLLNLGYYGCPTLCGFVLKGLTASLKSLDWTPGKQFEIVSVSIDPNEGFRLASQKKKNTLAELNKTDSELGWHFLTGKEDQIRKLASEVGFGYQWDENEKQWAHSAALIVLTPDGKISRYLYGIQYAVKDLRLSLLEASNGRIGTVIDRILLFCYRYDPVTGNYSVYLTNLMRGAGALTVLALGSFLGLFWLGQRRRRESDLHV